MLLVCAISGVVCVFLGVLAGRSLAERSPQRPTPAYLTGLSIGLLLWSVAVIAAVTLIPVNGAPGWVAAEGRMDHCSWDYGGPAPDGFWIFSGGQRLLNTALFVPSGALLVMAVARWRAGWLLAPLGLAALVGFSVLIESTQLAAARLDRACDVTDVVDNATGAGIGFLIGLVLVLLYRPWRR